jgi:hypothetical protein
VPARLQQRLFSKFLISGEIMRLSLAFCLTAGIASFSQSASQQVSPKTSGEPTQDAERMTFSNEQFSARIANRSLRSVSEELAAVVKVNVLLAEDIADNPVSLHVENVTIAEALHKLLVDYDAFLFYGGLKESPAVLRTVWVYPKGTASALRPVPPEMWGSTKELEKALSDSDPQVRERAYEALMSRPDARSRSLVIDALKGIRERDDGLRQRMLSTLMSKDFPIPSDVLADLARVDASDQIRWMALDAVSQQPSAKQVAESALLDLNEAVRERAKEILRELKGAASRPTAPPASDDQP